MKDFNDQVLSAWDAMIEEAMIRDREEGSPRTKDGRKRLLGNGNYLVEKVGCSFAPYRGSLRPNYV